MIRVCFTGTRSGMTPEQREAFGKFLAQYDWVELHHGDCVGADEEAHAIGRRHPGCRIVIHPPIKDHLRAWCGGDEVRPVNSYLARNRQMVAETDVTFGAPYHRDVPAGEPRGGTWYTIDYSEKRGRRTITCFRDGDQIEYRP